LVGLSKESEKYNGLITFKPTKTIHEVESSDLIIITAFSADQEKAIDLNQDFIPWIKQQRLNNNCEIASLCVGAFLLAETGLLNKLSASTHWAYAELFEKKYPEINLVSEQIITDENGIYTSGGAFSTLNLILYLIEKYNGREAAIWCSKMFEIEFDRLNQHQFRIFKGQKDHDDIAIKEAQFFIEKNYNEKILVDKLADTLAMSSRNFIRRFKKATLNTPSEYIQRVKVEVAKKVFESQQKGVGEVMFDVGYNDPKTFRDIFKKHTGLSPTEYKRKYNRFEAVEISM
jgi:transcriptional regulator GlxA family with amidase domain